MAKFRTKARAVDHLGKGQIADLPTAISELWKNGYDAYADSVSCDLFQAGYKKLESPLFLLSDDGVGMSGEDLQEKWIVLGTDSKARGRDLLSNEERLGKEPRVPLGEKGIGRLSVAYLGSPMLMLTKMKGKNLHLLFVDWRVLENYNLYLEDVDFPIYEIDEQRQSSIVNGFEKIINDFKKNLDHDAWEEHQDLKTTITDTLKRISLPVFLVEERFSPFLESDVHGTIFVIFDPHPQLQDLSLEGAAWASDADSTAKYLRSSLNGLTNQFISDEQKINASFSIHSDTGYYDLISKAEFFCRRDMFSVDHWLSGEFNEFGEFQGRLQVFDQNHEVFFRPRRPPGLTPYGPFKIEFGFIEGVARNSKLPREQWDFYDKKTDLFGGLYIYRDGFRVLPYGRPDFDFLEFEERRSKSATYYQFSHRRLLGHIDIARNRNPKLIDKAGREGFIVNKAYKEFKDDLIHFFVDLAVRYFRTVKEGESPTSRHQQVTDIVARNDRMLDAEKKKSKKTIKQFKENLNANAPAVTKLRADSENLYTKLQEEVCKPKIVYNDAQTLIEAVASNKELLKKLRLLKPARINFTPSLKQKYSDYLDQLETAMSIIEKCDQLLAEMQIHFSPENLEKELLKRVEAYKNNLKNRLENYRRRLVKSIDPLRQRIAEDVNSMPGEFAYETGKLREDTASGNLDYPQLLVNLDNLYNNFDEEITEKYDHLVNHIEGLDVEIDDDALIGWYKEEYDKISKKVDAMHELAQLGMAIEIIDHQFNVLYAEMDQAIKFFKQFSEETPDIKHHYNQLRHAFEHLETNHQLLTPLYRTTRRSRVEITGKELKEYLSVFFELRFKRHRIQFTTNKEFDEYIFYTYESVLMRIPVIPDTHSGGKPDTHSSRSRTPVPVIPDTP